MIIPDANLLLYAAIDAFPQHDAALSWWEDLLSSGERVGIVPATAFAFVRIGTSRRILEDPMTLEDASDTINEWLARPNVDYLSVSARHLEVALSLLGVVGTGGNLTTDAQIAAHALLDKGTVASNDADFKRFPDVPTINPLDS